MKRLLGLVVAVLAGSISNAEATTINFEDIAQAHGTETVVTAPTPVISDGFRFDAATHAHVSNATWLTDNGSTYLVVDEFFGPDPVTMSQVGSAPFALSSIDISEAHPEAVFSARQIQVTGNLFNGGTISTTLNLDNNLVDGVPANYFQTFTFGAGWDALSSVVFNGTNAVIGFGNYYAMDNIVVGPAASVPEPGTLTLIALGSAYMVRRRRRR